MHVEKNVCDSIIGTLLNIKGKTKDGINARKDLVEMSVRLELQPQPHGKRTYLPPACHTLSKSEKISFCGCLRGVGSLITDVVCLCTKSILVPTDVVLCLI